VDNFDVGTNLRMLCYIAIYEGQENNGLYGMREGVLPCLDEGQATCFDIVCL